MTKLPKPTTPTTPATENEENTFGQALAARLDASTDALPHAVRERLKSARVMAVSQRKIVNVQSAATGVAHASNSTLTLHPNDRMGLWQRLGFVLPLLLLVLGLIAIDAIQDDLNANEFAEVDTQLLSGELPPAAFTDPGFMHFLRINQNN